MFLKRELVGENARGLVDFLNENYNYCYLDSMHHLNKIIKPKNIVTGISYTLDAINPQIFTEPTINFAMHSQDLYYDYLHAKRAIEANDEIENCIISLGYYSLFYDMSRASTSVIISDVQYPLFHDTHNMTLDESVTEDYSSEKYIRERTFAREYFGRYPAYYGPAISLNLMAPDIGKLGGWSNLSPEKRDELARDVAGKHNRHIAHTATFEENVKILNDYIEISPYVSNNVLGRINGVNGLGKLSDIIVSELPLKPLLINFLK